MPSCRRAMMLRRQSRLAREVVFRSTCRRGRLQFDGSTYHISNSSSDRILNSLCSGGRGLSSGRASGPVGFVGLGNMGEILRGNCVVLSDHGGRAVLLTLYRMYRVTRSTIFEEDPPSSSCWLVGCLALLLCCCCFCVVLVLCTLLYCAVLC